jgi:hypothetical protein
VNNKRCGNVEPKCAPKRLSKVLLMRTGQALGATEITYHQWCYAWLSVVNRHPDSKDRKIELLPCKVDLSVHTEEQDIYNNILEDSSQSDLNYISQPVIVPLVESARKLRCDIMHHGTEYRPTICRRPFRERMYR